MREMRIIKDLFSFYINASIHVAFAVVALAVVTQLHFRLPLQQDLLFFILFGTVAGYNFVKYARIAGLHHRRLAKNLQIIQIFSLFSFIFCVFFAARLSLKVLLLAVFLGVVNLLYMLPAFGGKRNLRSIKGLKVHVIAFLWAGVTLLLPIMNYRGMLDMDVVIAFAQRYLLVLVLLLPFEIRDLKFDQVYLHTIPQRVGVRRTRQLGLWLLLIFVLLEFVKSTSRMETVVSVIFVAVMAGIALIKAKENQPRYFASFWVEGIPILWFLFLWVLVT